MGFSLYQCTPKISTPITSDSDVPLATDTIDEGPCKTWNNLPDKSDLIEMHVIYRDLLKVEKYDEAFPEWKYVYKAAPMADGRRTTHFDDGVKFYFHKYQTTQDESLKAEYKKYIFDSIFILKRTCADDLGRAIGQEAFQLYYNYRALATTKEIYERFKMSIDLGKEKTGVFVLNPFTRVLVELFESGQLDTLEAKEYAHKIRMTLKYGLANCAPDCNDWNTVNAYTPIQLERLERVRGFYDCNYYKERYLTQFDESPENCDVIETAYIRLKWGGCSNDDQDLLRVLEAKNKFCKSISTNEDLSNAKKCLETGDYTCAIENYNKYVSKTDDAEKKAKYLFRIAKIYYAHLKNFPKARGYALKAAKYKNNWGDPFMLIGSLYASSGPLCGPGTGWDSQIVTWPAIDKWQYAKKIDPSVRSKANKLINRYTQFMPSREDIFLRQIKAGSKFKVGCWINETTTVRVN